MLKGEELGGSGKVGEKEDQLNRSLESHSSSSIFNPTGFTHHARTDCLVVAALASDPPAS